MILAIYLIAVLGLYAGMHLFAEKGGWKTWLAFSLPLLLMIIIRYLPTELCAEYMPTVRLAALINPAFVVSSYFIGISYLAFRCSHLVLEVRNGTVKKPGIWEYLGFCFFPPTMSVGPINTYSNYRRGFGDEPLDLPIGRSLMRVLVGSVKFFFVSVAFNQLTYAGLLLDDHYHPWTDLPIAAVFYYIYLYLNFSGFCDMAIGLAGLIGIPVPENFNYPFLARNAKDFWNRWHITLSAYMRDVVFSPLSKTLGHRMGLANVNHAIAITIFVVFLLIGIWHGVGWNYAAFGFVQGVGVVTNHYYTIGLKHWLGREGFKAYNANPWIHAAAICVTFVFITFSMFFFANSPEDMKEILSELRFSDPG